MTGILEAHLTVMCPVLVSLCKLSFLSPCAALLAPDTPSLWLYVYFVFLAMREERRPESWRAIDKLDTPGTPPNPEHGPGPNLPQRAWDIMQRTLIWHTLPAPPFSHAWNRWRSVLLFCGYKPGQTPDYIRQRFAWQRASCQIVCPGPPAPSVTWLSYKWRRAAQLRERRQGEKEAGEGAGTVFSDPGVVKSPALALAPFYKVKIFSGQKGSFFLTELGK